MRKMSSNTVITSRVRLARNYAELPFVPRMNREDKEKLKEKLHLAIKKGPVPLSYIDMEQVDDIRAGAMVEDHTVSPEFAQNREGEGLFISEPSDNSLSVMVNEEDHLRIQAICDGFALGDAYALADRADDLFGEVSPYAFSERYGYLTCCPTNLGTGMRASVMMHLPVLSETGNINRFINSLSGLGLTVRGLYGEGSQPGGHIYQLSNQVSLGITEEEALQRLSDSAKKIEESELALQKKYLENISVKDRIHRAYGLLREARLLSSSEFLKLISDVRWGILQGEIPADLHRVDRLFSKAQPYNIMVSSQENSASLRDQRRAELVRNTLM